MSEILDNRYNTHFDGEYYIPLIQTILDCGRTEVNKRTGSEIKVLPHMVIKWDYGYIPITGSRKMYPHVAAAELAWSLLGTQDTQFIKQYSKMWSKFEDEPGKVLPAYGYRWRNCFGRDQISSAIRALQDDNSNRQVFISAWNPFTDGLSNVGRYKNVPCPIGFSLNIIEDKLYMSVYMRSSDVIVGLPYDIMMYRLLQEAFAESLEVDIGQLTMYLNHAHIYSSHYNIAKNIIKNYEMFNINCGPIDKTYIPQYVTAPGWNIKDIIKEPDEYVEIVKNIALINRRGLYDNKEPEKLYPEVIE